MQLVPTKKLSSHKTVTGYFYTSVLIKTKQTKEDLLIIQI